MTEDIKKHKRVNDILLGPLERPALKWLAEHSPAWMTPDILTGIGTLGAIVTFISYWMTAKNPAFFWLASFGFVLNWYGDSLDGTLARYRKIERPKYGFFVDHTVDSLNEVFVFLGLGLTPYIHFEYAALALIGYLLMSILVYVTTAVSGVFRISYGKFGPTEIRVIAILLNTAMFFWGGLRISDWAGGTSVYDVLVLGIAVILFAIYIVSFLRQAREMSALGE